MKNILKLLRWSAGITLLGCALLIGFYGLNASSIASGYKENHEEGEQRRNRFGLVSETSPVYQEECGSCHLAYPPGLLPAQSWTVMMSGLDNHFEENAELPEDTRLKILDYLDKHAAQAGDKVLRGSIDETLLRITELPYFVRKHDEIPEQRVKSNPGIGSFSNCDSCHQNAVQGDFDEDRITIPGYGRWDD
ncbi:MAG: diheme cytochrome c [Pseudomonadales bacterium]